MQARQILEGTPCRSAKLPLAAPALGSRWLSPSATTRRQMKHCDTSRRHVAGTETSVSQLEVPEYARGLPSIPGGPSAVIFDLDGTLTETELLKARSYACVATRLYGLKVGGDFMDCTRPPNKVASLVLATLSSMDEEELDNLPLPSFQGPSTLTPEDITNICIKAYMDNIGGTTENTAREIVDKLGLYNELRFDMLRLGVQEPWQALYKLHKEGWPTFCTKENIWGARYEHNLRTVWRAAQSGLPIGLATSSLTSDAETVLDFLGVRHLFSVVKGKDKVQYPKPAPEVYELVALELGVPTSACIAVEDSVTGATAASSAGLAAIMVANPFTAPMLPTQTVVPQDRVVYHPEEQAEYEACLERACKIAAGSKQA